MPTSIHHHRIPVLGDIIMGEVNPMFRETKMPKDKAEVSLGVSVISFGHI